MSGTSIARIVKILRWEKRDDHALVHVRTDDGSEATIYVGGEVELFFSRGHIKAHVKRAQSRGKIKP